MEDPRDNKLNWSRWDMDRVRYHLDKPPAPHREIRPLGDILQDVVADIEKPECDNILVLRKSWPGIAGTQIATHSRPESLQNFVLQISVDHPGWLPELERLKRALLKKLQAKYPQLRIRQLYFFLSHRC